MNLFPKVSAEKNLSYVINEYAHIYTTRYAAVIGIVDSGHYLRLKVYVQVYMHVSIYIQINMVNLFYTKLNLSTNREIPNYEGSIFNSNGG